ncbi:hypothetical protein Peur_041607 [Populus x canadensis]
MSEHGQEPQHNPVFVQSATPAPAPTVMDAFANKSHQAKSSDSLDQEKIAALEARIKVIEGVDLYDPSGRIVVAPEKRGFERKEVNHVGDNYRGRKTSSQSYHTPSQVADIKKPEPQNFQAKSQIGNYQRVQEQLPPLPLPLDEMYHKLLSIGQVAPEPLTPVQPPYPSWYKPELTCEYHAGVAGHSIHTCNAFKRKLLQLIKAGWIELEDTSNVNTNPLPNHA